MDSFLEHVKNGLSAPIKKLSSRYFYDDKGSKIYQKIMASEEYYLPELEMEIILNQSEDIAEEIAENNSRIEVIELGAGDGSKTAHILKAFDHHFDQLSFTALDISSSILEENRANILKAVPELKHQAKPGDYFKTFEELEPSSHSRLVLFLGANIGNYGLKEAGEFFQFINKGMSEDDYFLVAFDMVKDPETILSAYNDKEGHTAAFNLNLLERINRELGGNFDLSQFKHHPFYNPLTGICSSQLISLKDQLVCLEDGSSFHFKAFEPIHTEISKKYFERDIEILAKESGMEIIESYTSANAGYSFVLFASK